MRTVLAHGHLFKNAGTTLDWSLERSFGDSFLDHRDDEAMIQNGTEHVADLLQSRSELQALSSHHLTRQLPELAGIEIVPVYMLRHPLERVESVYHFERAQQADTPGAEAAKKYTLAEYVAWRMTPGVSRTIRNMQTVFLSGKFHAGNRQPLGLQVFAMATKALRTLPLVGVVDRYDEFMVVLEQYFAKTLPQLDLAYVRQNESKFERPAGMSERIAHLLEQLGDLQQPLIDENSMDLALYQLANVRLDQAIQEIDDFPQRLQAFRDRCGKFLLL